MEKDSNKWISKQFEKIKKSTLIKAFSLGFLMIGIGGGVSFAVKDIYDKKETTAFNIKLHQGINNTFLNRMGEISLSLKTALSECDDETKAEVNKFLHNVLKITTIIDDNSAIINIVNDNVDTEEAELNTQRITDVSDIKMVINIKTGLIISTTIKFKSNREMYELTIPNLKVINDLLYEDIKNILNGNPTSSPKSTVSKWNPKDWLYTNDEGEEVE